jgi:hypothetical protein
MLPHQFIWCDAQSFRQRAGPEFLEQIRAAHGVVAAADREDAGEQHGAGGDEDDQTTC